MPIYEYRCEECHQVFEEWQNDFEEREVPCPVCGGGSERMISHSAFILKGSGWYVTDYSRKGTAAGGNGNGNGNGKNGQKKDAAAADSPGDRKSADHSAKPGAEAKKDSKNKSSSTQAGASQ
ncbi:MAG: FmdB family zinc ribbon protein [Thermodesulfobacteriota bacterium]